MRVSRLASNGGQDKWLIVGLVALNVFLCVALFEPKIHTGGDNALYILLSESIRAFGDGYSTSIAPGPAVPHTTVPPGYPLLLAMIGGMFGRNFVLLKLLSVALTAGTVWVFCLLVRDRAREWGRYPWFLISFAFAANPLAIDYSHWILSEAAFVFFIMLSLFFLQRESGKRPDRWFCLALLAAVASFYIRSVGVLLLVAVSVGYLVRRQWRKFFVHGLAGGALTVPWLVRNHSLEGTASPYLEQFSLVSIYSPDAGVLDLLGRAQRVMENVWLYVSRELPRALVGSTSPWSVHPVVDAIALVLCILAIVGLVRTVKRKPGAMEFYFVLTFAAITLFQRVATDVRYLVPLFPFLLVYAFDGAVVVGNAARHRIRQTRVLPVVVAGTLIGAALFSVGARIPSNIEMLSAYSAGDRYAGYPPAWRRFFEAAEYVRTETSEDAVVTVRKPRLFHLWTGRRTRIFPFTTDRDSVLSVILSTDHVVVDQTTRATTARYLVPVVYENLDRIRCGFRTGEPYTYVCAVGDTRP